MARSVACARITAEMHGDGGSGLEAEGAALKEDLDKAEAALSEEVEAEETGGPIRRVITQVAKEQSAEGIGLVASGAAFWLVIGTFPAAIAAVSIFGLLVSPERVASDLASISRAGPESLGSILSVQLQHIANADRVGLSTSLAVSLVLALWSVSAAVYNLNRAVRTAYGLPVARYVKARGRAFVGGLVAVVALGVVGLASTTISVVLAYVPGVLAAILGIPLLGLFVAGLAGGLYRFAIGHPVGVRRLLPGAVASGAGLVIVAIVFSVYLRQSTHYTAVYGALAGAVIGMVGAYLAIYVLLIGAVLNAQLDHMHGRIVPGGPSGSEVQP
jgi:membrane protein